MKTLLGWSTVTSAERNGVKRDALFKRLAIYFEYIVFNNQLTPVGLPLPGVGKLSQREFLSYIVAKDKYEAVRLQKIHFNILRLLGFCRRRERLRVRTQFCNI
ncbi:hypothetical protein [Vibrio sp. CJQ_6]|uniref:hypothetical protein n=1 Tax=Vibrio sp. CJQ_6 TaxID=3367165 RepID=UPI00370C7944